MNRLAEVREARGLSQRELGALLGVTRQMVNQWEHGRVEPGTAWALRIAKALGCRVDDIFRLVEDGPWPRDGCQAGQL